MTDTPLETDDATALERVVTSTDANTLGRYWIGAGSLTLLASLVAGVLVALERLDLGGTEVFGSADEIFQFWSAHRVGFVLLAIVPILVGLGTAVAPFQVGSDSIAFPRMAAFFLLDLADRCRHDGYRLPDRRWARHPGLPVVSARPSHSRSSDS
jgi:heme/copper-type cytochrome/quinol oxidase subunit 1